MWTQIRLLLIWVHTVCKNVFENRKQMTKQMAIVVIGSLRVKEFCCLVFCGTITDTILSIFDESNKS